MIKTCMFPAGGLGARFLPATKSLPKEMLPIVDTPLLQYGVEEALDAGMTDMAIVTGKTKRAIADYFDRNIELEQSVRGTSKEKLLASLERLIGSCRFLYTRQGEAKGLGHAILTGEPLIGNQAFGVILADDLCVNRGDGVMTQLIKVYEKYQCSVVAIEEVAPSEVGRYGVISFSQELEKNIYRVDDMVEKPEVSAASSNLAIIGRYILTPDIFDIIRALPAGKNGEIQITDALLQQAKKNQVVACRFNGRRFDCGSINGYMSANNYFFNLRD